MRRGASLRRRAARHPSSRFFKIPHPRPASLGLLVIILALATRVSAQTGGRTQVIRGHVTSDSGTAIPAADVVVTVAPSAENFLAKTDSSGAYRVVITDGTGEYVLYIGALGRKPFRQRVTLLDRDSAIVDATLATAITQVAAVRVQATKPRPARSLGNDGAPGTDATDKTFDGASGALPPDLQGNLDAMASLIPGLSATPAGVSAFGMSSAANGNLLNGLAFSGTDLPRDAATTTRFRTSPWDPTIGGFSGVQYSTTLASGSNVTRRAAHLTLDAPELQFADPVASHLGQTFTNLAADEGGTGAYLLDKLYYNFGLHVQHEVVPVASLADLNAAALATGGVSIDSAARALQALGGLGAPVSAFGAPTERTYNAVSFIERVDRAPAPAVGNGSSGPTLAFTGIGKYSESQGVALSPTIAPDFAGKSADAMIAGQGLYSRYFGPDGSYINETTSGVTLVTDRGTPYARTPGGTVLVPSTFSDGTAGIGTLDFGGNGVLATNSQHWIWETVNQTDFLINGHQSLPAKIYFGSRLDGFSLTPGVNSLGTFVYPSLGALDANQPSSYSRILDSPTRSGGEWTGTGAFGATWTRPTLTLTGGARVDGNVFTQAPAENGDIARLFGVNTDHAPDDVALSPRLGFVWKYRASTGFSSLSAGTANWYKGQAQIRGGIGRFHSSESPTLLSDALGATGLPGETQELLCVGAAVPTPDWSAYAQNPSAIPSACAGAASTFADQAPNVVLFDRAYQPSDSWRATLGWTSSDLFGSYVAIDGAYSLNVHQPGVVDLNFSGTPQFTVPGEDNRPVFVDAASIVPATGALSPAGSRIDAGYGSVTDRVSDLRGSAKQVTVYAIPNLRIGSYIVIGAYTYADARSEASGFDQSTAGDPRVVDRTLSSYTPHHSIILQVARNFLGGDMASSFALRASSGFAYTPLVGADINGDGLANDRAFIFDPTTVRDTALAGGLRSLLANGPSGARDCLASQLGAVAGANSCTGPWSATMNANIAFYQVAHTNGRARVFVSFTNVLGALDEALHGSDHLHGWGLFPLPDPVLYQVRGFDEATHAFIYEVNPRFGSTSLATTTRRNPFRITLDVRLDVGRPVVEQQLEQNLRMRPSLTGTRAPADSIKARYMRAGTAGFVDIYAAMLRLNDSLALSRDQFDRIRAREIVLRARADTLFAGLATYLASQRDVNLSAGAAHVRATVEAMWQMLYDERPFILDLLTPGQIRLLPNGLRELVTTPNYRGRFGL